MGVIVISGNIFTSKCQTIVNTINCVGVMGAGIALEVRLRYPDLYEKYVKLCTEKKIDIGLLWVYKAPDRWVLNFPTKRHWKYPSKLEYLHAGLKKFVETYEDREVKSIAFPLLGADKGGIAQDVSLEIMLGYLSELNIDIEIYKYDALAKDDLFERVKSWLLSQDPGVIAEVAGVRRNYVERLIEAVCDPKIVQLNQIAKIDGIGIKTLEGVFKLARSVPIATESAMPGQQSLL
ncbi:macro domain-containing protein [Aromatoleum bremense]|uniref:Appr-1-p processing protein n=1 Tax=Aromatoleum bremense TaxID=76115 RepID=A0ABX1NQQ5_9RHOO|nr:macro domain-containing protein [Aromatoleum bremense]NMG14228.1 Appr-1-p processing protein [Aromatoleum bremense]QTQ34008.1 Macro domain-containing protein [Aromatoleum bremense]